jgi:TonB family protein
MDILQKHCLWLSLLIHFLLFGGYVLNFYAFLPPVQEHEPMPGYVPSYVEQSKAQTPAPAEPPPQIAKHEEPKKPVEKKPIQTAKNGIEKPVAQTKQIASTKSIPKKPAAKSVNSAPQKITEAIVNQNHEPMHLIGESKIIKPLIKILAKALSQHLIYPKIAEDFNLRGTVLVGFMLHPQGYVTESRVVKSSGAGVLDDAAREAVDGMSPVMGVGEFMQKPEFLVVGIIFG